MKGVRIKKNFVSPLSPSLVRKWKRVGLLLCLFFFFYCVLVPPSQLVRVPYSLFSCVLVWKEDERDDGFSYSLLWEPYTSLSRCHALLLCTKVLDFSVVAVVNLFVSLSPLPCFDYWVTQSDNQINVSLGRRNFSLSHSPFFASSHWMHVRCHNEVVRARCVMFTVEDRSY